MVSNGASLPGSEPGISPSGFSSAIEKKLPSLLEDCMISIKGIIDKVASRKLAVTAAAGAAAATGVVDITLPVAIVAAAYIIGQTMVDAFGD